MCFRTAQVIRSLYFKICGQGETIKFSHFLRLRSPSVVECSDYISKLIPNLFSANHKKCASLDMTSCPIRFSSKISKWQCQKVWSFCVVQAAFLSACADGSFSEILSTKTHVINEMYLNSMQTNPKRHF